MQNKSADVLIVGSGLTGCSCAYYCVKKGLSVIVLDEDIIGNGASSRNGGGVRAFFRNPLEMPLAKYAIANIWSHLSEELGADIEYKQGGNFRLGIGEEEQRILEKLAAEGNAQGLNVKMLYGKEIQDYCPLVSTEVTAGALCVNDGRANPMKTTLAMYSKSRALGAKYYTGQRVAGIGLDKGKISQVTTDDGTVYTTNNVIVTAGQKSSDLLKTAGIDLPIMPVLLEAFVTEAMEHSFDFMLGTARSAFYGHQTNHGSFAFGGGSGLEQYNQRNYDKNNTRNITAPSVMRGIMHYFPALADLKIIRTWAGWTDHTPDNCCVVGAIDEVPGLYVGAGYSGHGFCMGPVTGKLISELITGAEPCVPYKQLAYNRFKAKQ